MSEKINLKPLSFKEYHKIIVTESWNKFKKERSFWDALFTIVIFAFLVGAIYVAIIERPRSWVSFWGSGSMIIAFITALVFGFVYTAIYLAYIRKQYVFEHNKQLDRHSSLQREMENTIEEKDLIISKFEQEIREIKDNKKNVRLMLSPVVEGYGKRVNLVIKNKNSKSIMDCRAKLKRLVVFLQDGSLVEKYNEDKETFHFRWHEKNLINLDNPWPSDPVREKPILSYDDESFELNEIVQMGWDNSGLAIEFHSCEGNIQIVTPEKTSEDYSVVQIGVSLDLIFDFEDETRIYPYSQIIRFEKKLNPIEIKGEIGFQPPLIDFKHFDWNENNLIRKD
ncbi:MAG: hypothetical protein J0M11_12925 [Anaerolineae bacterium]|nr:hypothetical protein [Anaerolineae bacterium]